MRAEAFTLQAAVESTAGIRNVPLKAFFTDSASSLAALQKGPLRQRKHSSLAAIWSCLERMFGYADEQLRTDSVSFQFIYAHCGVDGNELVDTQAGNTLRGIESGILANRRWRYTAEIDMESFKASIRKHLNSSWIARMNEQAQAREEAGLSPFPRFTLEEGGTAASPRKALNAFSRQDAALIRQLRVGETRGAGKFYARLSNSPERVRCRWCVLHCPGTVAPSETIPHLFNNCPAPPVMALRLDQPMAPRVCLDTLFTDPARALVFYRACLALLPHPAQPAGLEAEPRA